MYHGEMQDAPCNAVEEVRAPLFEWRGYAVSRELLIRIAPWWLAVLIVGSLLPGPEKNYFITPTSPLMVAQAHPALWHRLFHYLTFGSTAAMLMLIGETLLLQVAAAFGVGILGLALEWAQFRIYQLPQMEWWDARDDAFACIAVYLLMRWYAGWHTRLHPLDEFHRSSSLR
jgi:hypothetical protein